MPLSSKRKVSFGALGLMVAALGVDRFVLNPGDAGPQTASASMPVQPLSVPPAESLLVANRVAPAIQKPIALRLDDARATLARMEFARRVDQVMLRRVYGKDPGDDLFHATPQWLIPAPATKEEAAAEKAADVDLMKDFSSKHRLTSVMFGGKTTMVVIDGVCIKQGDQFAGLRLTKVEQGAAVFEDGDKSVRLTVDSMFDKVAEKSALK